MKLRKLTIHNIASLADATIDFDAAPLDGADVFLISGNTGAGKTTILDAISLALYGKTPRLQARREREEDNGVESVRPNHPSQLLRRQTGEGFVKLLFTGNNGRDYEATWRVWRAHNRPDGRFQGPERTLLLVEAGNANPESKISDISREIQLAVGLDFEQFTRTTLLAQGDFAKFLESEESQKADILEKITDSAQFRRMGQSIYEIYREKEDKYRAAQTAAGAMALLTQGERTRERRILASLHMAVKEEGRKEKEMRDALGWLEAIENADSQIRRSTERLARYETDYLRYLKGMHALGEKKAADQETLAKVEESLKSREPRRKTIEEGRSIAESLARLAGLRDDVKKHLRDTETLQARIEKQTTSRDKAKETCDAKAEAMKEADTKRERKKEEVESLHIDTLRKEKETIETTLQAISEVRGAIKTYLTGRQDLSDLTEAYGKKQTDEKEAREAHQKLQPLIEEAAGEEKKAYERYEGQKATVDEWAKKLRANLKLHDICPVCRQSIETTVASEEELARLIAGYRKEYEEARERHVGLQRRASAEKARVETLASQLQTEAKQMDKRRKKVEADKTEATQALEALKNRLADDDPETVRNFNLNLDLDIAQSVDRSIDDTLETALGGFAEERRRALAELTGKIKAAEEKEAELKTLEEAARKAVKERDKAKENLDQLDRGLSDLKAKASTVAALTARKQSDASLEEEKIKKRVEGEWATDWQTDPMAFARELETEMKAYAKDQERRTQLRTGIANTDTELRQLETTRGEIIRLMPRWGDIRAEEGETLTDPGQHGATLVGNVSAALETIRNAETTRKEQEDRLAASPYAPEPGHGAEAGAATLRDKLATTRDALDRLNSETGRRRQILHTDAENRLKAASLREEADRLLAERDKWKKLNEHLGSLTGDKFQKIAQAYMLQNLVEAANSYLATLYGRYRLRSVAGSFIIMVEDSYQGGERRNVATLSGGERFLVSLSLALALSDIGRNLHIDTLFIDEGFGSLSGDPLQNAISTLRTLHSATGRRVGIISHVEELRERIHTQIRVEQDPRSPVSTITVSGN